MQKNQNTSSESANNALSLDSIINEYDGKNSTDTDKKSYDEAMKKLDELFAENDEDLEWLDGVINGEESSDKSENVQESDDAEISQDDVIIAENADEEAEAGSAEDVIQAAPDADVTTESVTTEEAAEVPSENAEEVKTETVEGKAGEAFVEEEGTDINSIAEEAFALPEEGDEDVKKYTPKKKKRDNDGKTRQYNTVKKKQASPVEFDVFENDEKQDKTEEVVKTTDKKSEGDFVNKSLGRLFGSADDDKSDDDKVKSKSEHKKIARQLGAYEEIDMTDSAAVNAGLNFYYMKKCRALITLFCVAVCMLVGLYFELSHVISLPLPLLISPANPAVYALLDLQILCFAAIFTMESLANGFLSILDRRFSPASCALVIAGATAIQAIATAIASPEPEKLRVFCTIGVLSLLMLALYDYLKASADDKSFRIASSSSNKFGAYELGVDSPECSPFISHIDPEKAKVITVCKGSVYDGFVDRNQRRPEGEKNLGKIVCVVAAVALIIGVVSGIITRNAYVGITGMAIIISASVPLNIFIVSALPKYLASRKGKEIGAALVGQNASEEYKGLAVVAFEDTEVFLPKDVRISSIKTYSGMALDEAVVLMARIYGKVGGPLSKIFAKMVDIKNISGEVTLEKVYPDAIRVRVDSREVYLATSSYLGANGIRTITDSVDAAFEQSHGSILFMVCNNKIVAKFYIKYSVNPAFEKTLTELHNANLCVGIKTLDPCITNDLVFGCLEKSNYALSVIKLGVNDIPKVREKVSSGVVALGSVHNFLEMLLLCEKSGRNVKINNGIKLISAVACALLSTLFVFANGSLNVIFCIIIQLFWMIPVAVISYFNK